MKKTLLLLLTLPLPRCCHTGHIRYRPPASDGVDSWRRIPNGMVWRRPLEIPRPSRSGHREHRIPHWGTRLHGSSGADERESRGALGQLRTVRPDLRTEMDSAQHHQLRRRPCQRDDLRRERRRHQLQHALCITVGKGTLPPVHQSERRLVRSLERQSTFFRTRCLTERRRTTRHSLPR